MLNTHENQTAINTILQTGTHQIPMNLYCATPYDISAPFFYFDTYEEFQTLSAALRNSYGQPVEEFEIDVIEAQDADLFQAAKVNQANLETYLGIVEESSEDEKIGLFFLLDHFGYDLEKATEHMSEVCFTSESLEDYAYNLFFECYGHTIPENLHTYFDTSSFAKDLSMGGDVIEFEYEGTSYLCTNPLDF